MESYYQKRERKSFYLFDHFITIQPLIYTLD